MKKLLTLLLGGMMLLGLMGLPAGQAAEMEAFERVLSLDEALLDLNRGDMVTLDAWRSDYTDEPVFFTWIAFVDLDRDGETEAVLAFDLSDWEQAYLVLDLWEGQVLGHEVVSRGLQVLKADGSFSYASGAMDNGCGWYNLASGATEVVPNSWMERTSEGGVRYFVGGQPSDEAG